MSYLVNFLHTSSTSGRVFDSFLYLAAEETEAQRSGDLPKVTEMGSGGAGI